VNYIEQRVEITARYKNEATAEEQGSIEGMEFAIYIM
jgi:hypothetical protein